MMRQDSIRLRTGGTAPVQKVSEKSAQSNELLTTRFRRADSTLSRADIRELYFSVDGREDTAPFLSKIELRPIALSRGRTSLRHSRPSNKGCGVPPRILGSSSAPATSRFTSRAHDSIPTCTSSSSFSA